MQKQWMGVHFGKSEGIRSCGKLICTNCNFQWRVFWAPNKRNGSVKNKVLHGPIMSCPIFLSYIHVDECVGSNRTTNGFQGSYFSALHALGRHHPPAKIWLTTSQTLKHSNSQKNTEELETKELWEKHVPHHLYHSIPSWKYLCIVRVTWVTLSQETG